ncbi:MAG: DUF2399 domain-containing protein [Pseudonocardiales bacterium]|nr:DUF2399 domain-containing protein [Pseudonocardiales bacterium]MBV9028718.1 DUF2399 domain-containing protein [Pseudonocardiales bacterium]
MRRCITTGTSTVRVCGSPPTSSRGPGHCPGGCPPPTTSPPSPTTDRRPAGRLTGVPWDPHLAAALAEHGVAVPEERVAPVLLDDLATQLRADRS